MFVPSLSRAVNLHLSISERTWITQRALKAFRVQSESNHSIEIRVIQSEPISTWSCLNCTGVLDKCVMLFVTLRSLQEENPLELDLICHLKHYIYEGIKKQRISYGAIERQLKFCFLVRPQQHYTEHYSATCSATQ